MTANNWRTRAACRQHDPDWWFATGPESVKRQQAQVICRTECPVRAECAAWALRHGIEYGIFGGMTARERNIALRRAGRRRKVQPTQRRMSATR